MSQPTREQIEAAARAICVARHLDPDKVIRELESNPPPKQWMLWCEEAKASIAALESRK